MNVHCSLGDDDRLFLLYGRGLFALLVLVLLLFLLLLVGVGFCFGSIVGKGFVRVNGLVRDRLGFAHFTHPLELSIRDTAVGIPAKGNEIVWFCVSHK